MDDNYKNSLLIIGNGFDLALGLHSSFSNFLRSSFNYSLKDFNNFVKSCKEYYVKEIGGKFNFYDLELLLFNDILNKHLNDKEQNVVDYCYNEYLNFNTINFWAFYLYLKKGENVKDWSTIEYQIYELISLNNFDLLRICNEFSNYLMINTRLITIKYKGKRIPLIRLLSNFRKYYRLSQKPKESLYNNDIHKLILVMLLSIKSNREYKGHINSNRITNFDDVYNMVLYYLKQEIYEFERELNNYLLKQVKNYRTINNYTYDEIGEQLLKALTDSKKFSLFNFNYTNPTGNMNPKKSNFPFVSRRNIHGVLTNYFAKKGLSHRTSPILGIDDSTIDIDDPAYTFTKNYRIIRLSCNNYNDIFKTNIHQIEFFGHSFDSADYSYFRDIFNNYNVKGCKTKLIFYYICHSGKTDDECAVEQMDDIRKLFYKYCDTENEAKELIHTLSLRGKLEVTNLYDKISDSSELGKQLNHVNGPFS